MAYFEQTQLTTTPPHDVAAAASRLVGQNVAVAGFSAVGNSVLDPFFNTPIVGSGVSYNQAQGALNIVAGTTTNAEFLARSVSAFRGSMRLRHTIFVGSRLVNSNFAVMLADLIGENLAVTVNSATSITVAIPGHTFDATNVGQFMLVGGIQGISGGVPGRYAIASVVAGVSITLTVAGWPASGTGTATVFGRNYVRNLFTGTSATVVNVDAQRNGWATGDTAATINSTASPGTLLQVELTGREVFWSDSVRGTTTTPTFVTRASRYENICDQNIDLYVFLWSFNGTTSPGAVTWQLGHLSVESFSNVPMYVQGFRSLGQQNPIPVQLQASSNAIGSVLINSGIPAGVNMIGSVYGSSWYTDSQTALGAGASFTGTSRDLGATSNVPWCYFQATFFADQAGTAFVEYSIEGTVWTLVATGSLVANTALTLRINVVNRFHRVRFTNGGTAQSVFRVSSSFSAS